MGGISRVFVAALLGLALFAIRASDAIGDPTPVRVPILVYHRFGPTVADSMTVTTAVFAEQLAWLKSHDYRIIPLRTLAESLRDPAKKIPPRSVVITADDGHKSVYTEMLPLIRRDRFPVTLFIYPSAISNASYALTWEELAEIAKSGLVDVQSHTYWHPNFNHERARLSPDAYRTFVMMQLTRSKQVISQHLGTSVDMLSWPFGIYNAELEQWAAMAGYRIAVTLERRDVTSDADPLALPRYLMTDRDRGVRFVAIVAGAEHHGSRP